MSFRQDKRRDAKISLGVARSRDLQKIDFKRGEAQLGVEDYFNLRPRLLEQRSTQLHVHRPPLFSHYVYYYRVNTILCASDPLPDPVAF